MLRRAALFLVLSSVLSSAADELSAFDLRVGDFHLHWDKFLRTYLGCPKGAHEVTDCDRAVGHLDYVEFFAARKAARKLFSD